MDPKVRELSPESKLQRIDRTAAQLQLSEHCFRITFEASPVGMLLVNQSGQILMSNSALNKLFGYESGELLGRSVESLVPTQYRDQHVRHRQLFFDNLCQRPMGAGRDLYGIRKDGVFVPVELGLTPIVSDTETGVLGTVVDLTARNEAERAIRESEERLRLLIDGAKDYSILALDRAGFVTSWSLGAKRLNGFEASEIVGRHFSCLYPEEYRQDEAPAHLLETASNAGTVEVEGWRIRKDGSRFWANVIITATLDEQGELVGFTKVTRDLTEHKRTLEDLRQANQSLKSTQAVLRTLLDESANFIGLMRTDGTLIDANRTALEFIDATAEQVLYKPFVDTPWWQHSTELQTKLRESIELAAGGQLAGFEATHVSHQGECVSFQFTLKPVKDDSGDVIYLIPEGVDISQHKQREQQLSRLISEVETSNQELEQFAYVASHDLQEPLRKIASYAQLFKEEYGANLNAEAEDYLNVVMDGAKRLKILIADLLSFSRIATQGKALGPTNAATCLLEAIGNLEMAIDECSAEITYDHLPVVEADKSQLTMLFQNLVGNAVKYRRDAAPRIHVGVRDLGSIIEISVSDNGIGIDQQFYDRIFQIFQRLHNRREYSGTGIGLAICKRIVERFGGKIWLESTVGAGSTFFFTLKKFPVRYEHQP